MAGLAIRNHLARWLAASRLLDLSDFVGVLEGARPGQNYVRGRCPFGGHIDDDPSLVVYGGDDPHFHCYGCKKHGSWQELWETLSEEPAEYPERLVTETVEHGPWYRPSWYQWEDLSEYVEAAHQRLLHNVHHHWYVQERGLFRSIRPYRIGYDEGWLTIPIYLPSGVLDGVVARAYPAQAEKAEMRYDMPGNQGRMMYVPDWKQWREADVVYIVFGILDAISMALAGLPTASPTTGKDSFRPRWVADAHASVVVVPDRDEDDTANELAVRLPRGGRVHSIQYPDGCDDPNDILAQYGADKLRELVYA